MPSWLYWGNERLLLAAIPIPKSSESQEHCRPQPQPQGHPLLQCPRENNKPGELQLNPLLVGTTLLPRPPSPAPGQVQRTGKSTGKAAGCVVLHSTSTAIPGALCTMAVAQLSH